LLHKTNELAAAPSTVLVPSIEAAYDSEHEAFTMAMLEREATQFVTFAPLILAYPKRQTAADDDPDAYTSTPTTHPA
jgi:hypothetical protein